MKPIFSLVLAGMCLVGRTALGNENLLQNGSFESPAVTGKVHHGAGGNPAQAESGSSWLSISDKKDQAGGEITLGVTKEIARTGSQALYVDFRNVSAVSQTVWIDTKPIPVQPNTAYRVSIWGRVDLARPLSLDERRPSMWLDVAFLQQDGKTPAGDRVEGVTMLPGAITPGMKSLLSFRSRRWSPFSSAFQTPAGTAFIQITWSWVIPKDQGVTDGVIYWDDATLVPAPRQDGGQQGAASPSNLPATTP